MYSTGYIKFEVVKYFLNLKQCLKIKNTVNKSIKKNINSINIK